MFKPSLLSKSLLSLAVIAVLGGQVFAGRVPSPGVGRKHIVLARSTYTYDMTFRAGERAIVRVVGDGSTDLDLVVYDENGNLIVKDTATDDTPVVSWTPRWTGKFRIVVRNLGYRTNVYDIFTN